MNELLFFLAVIVVYSAVLYLWGMFGKSGMFAWVAFAPVVANILTVKQITLFGLDVTMGTVLFASVFLATDILAEFEGKEEAKKAAWMSFFFICAFIVVARVAIMFTPNDFDFSQGSLESIFGTSIRISVASAVVFLGANLLDVHLFDALKKKRPDALWLRNNLATTVSNCAENFLFVVLAFCGTMPLKECLLLALGTSIIELVTSFCDTPFLYAAKRL